MDVDGVWAEVVHPNAGLFVYDLDDPDLAYICAAIYNDHVAEMYQSERIYPNAVIPILDADAAAAEIERAAGLGLHGIELPQTPPASCPYYDPFYEPVWTAAEKHRLPIAMHVATGPNPNKEMGVSAFDFVGRVRTIPEEGSMRDTALLARQLARGGFGGVGGECLETIPDLVAGGVLERHPDLHFVFVEVGARWLALLMDNMDDSLYLGPGVRLVQRLMYAADGTALPQYVPGEMELEWSLPLRPSDYVKRQVHVSFMDDYVALRNRDITTISPLLWGNDYPHYEGSWPKSRDAIRQQCERVDLTDDERRAIFGGTTAKLWSMA
jgi:predicted TIM-barrel fold metal-dependent hydrolase